MSTDHTTTCWVTETIIDSDNGPEAPRLWIGTDEQGDVYIGTIRTGERKCMHATRLCGPGGGARRSDVRLAVLLLAATQASRPGRGFMAAMLDEPDMPDGWGWEEICVVNPDEEIDISLADADTLRIVLASDSLDIPIACIEILTGGRLVRGVP